MSIYDEVHAATMDEMLDFNEAWDEAVKLLEEYDSKNERCHHVEHLFKTLEKAGYTAATVNAEAIRKVMKDVYDIEMKKSNHKTED